MRTTRTVMRHPRAPGSLTAEDIVRHPEESGGVDKEPRGNKCAGVPQGSMAQEPDCTHRVATSPKQANICQLGRFRGLVTDGMCRRCIKDGLNVATIIEPSLLTKAKNFAVASAKHIAAGAPHASDEEVARRFAICEGCEHFDGRACRQCGCPVVRERQYLSKLSWADSSCPVGKWGPVPG